jgi:hypothetical protein
MNLSDVLIMQTEPAYTVFLGVSAETPAGVLQEAHKEGRELVPWKQFVQRAAQYLAARLLKNEYPDIQVAQGLIELLATNPGMPFGLTWNGGLAYTFSDYHYAQKTYRRYRENPEGYERIRVKDQQGDPVHPMNHLGPLLGW